MIYDLPINIAEAALGVNKTIPTLDDEDEDLKLPKGTQHGSEFRIKGKGIPHLNSNRRGDLRIMVNVRVPGSLNQRQQELLQELAASFAISNGNSNNDEGHEEEDKGIFDKLKDKLS